MEDIDSMLSQRGDSGIHPYWRALDYLVNTFA